MEYIKLIGVLVIVVGFVLKFDTISTVIIAGLATALVSGIEIPEFLEILGKAFVDQRYVSLFLLTLSMVGVAEAYGLKIQAVKLIEKMKNLSMGLFYSGYLIFRLIAGMLSLRMGGVASFVRPIVLPMGEAAINASIAGKDHEAKTDVLETKDLDKIKGLASANENFGNFYGQNMFAGSAGVLLIAATLSELGYEVNPGAVAIASIPVGIVAGIIGTAYNFYVDKSITRKYKKGGQK